MVKPFRKNLIFFHLKVDICIEHLNLLTGMPLFLTEKTFDIFTWQKM